MNRPQLFLACYRVTGSVAKACQAAKIDRQVHYRQLKRDPAYVKAFEAAQRGIDEEWAADSLQRAKELAAKVQELEDVVWARALHGIDEPVVFKGQLSYPLFRNDKGRMQRSTKPVTIRKFEHSREAFLLRGALPAKYRERFQHEVSGTINVSKFKGTMPELLEMFRTLTQEPEEEK